MQCRYLDNLFGSTKHCVVLFKAAGPSSIPKAERVRIRDVLARAKTYDGFDALVDGDWTGGEAEFQELKAAILARDAGLKTPFGALNPEGGPRLMDAPGAALTLKTLESWAGRPETPSPQRAPPPALLAV